MALDFNQINKDKNLFAVDGLPLITIYDDNFFVRNDYDVLSVGQRNYLINYFVKLGFKQQSGKVLSDGKINIHLPAPNSNLAVSSFSEALLNNDLTQYYCVTPTLFAETLFHQTLQKDYLTVLKTLRKLVKKCPYNIEWLRDVSYRSPIEEITVKRYSDLTAYQKFIIDKRYKSKKAL